MIVEDEKTNNIIKDYLSFDDLDLKDELLRGIYSYGFEKPSSIQQRAIKPMIDGHDLIAQAQSGTGKTATFLIGTLECISGNKQTEAIILSPTRELSVQTQKVAKNISNYMDINIQDAIGGTNLNENMFRLRNNPQIIVGTPGRVLDMIFRNIIKTDNIKLLVIDEVDEMLSKGFKEQIQNVFKELKNDVQVTIFSATMPPEVLQLTTLFMKNPINILVKNDEVTLEGIKQYYINVEKEEYKFETLCDLYMSLSVAQSIIYCSSKKKVEELASKLTENNYVVSAIHGDMNQDERNNVMNEFRSGSARILITTNLLARGIDVQQVSVVINLDMPNYIEDYIHRIGRSGRFGRKGVAINIVSNRDYKTIIDIEKYYSTQILEMPANIDSLI